MPNGYSVHNKGIWVQAQKCDRFYGFYASGSATTMPDSYKSMNMTAKLPRGTLHSKMMIFCYLNLCIACKRILLNFNDIHEFCILYMKARLVIFGQPQSNVAISGWVLNAWGQLWSRAMVMCPTHTMWSRLGSCCCSASCASSSPCIACGGVWNALGISATTTRTTRTRPQYVAGLHGALPVPPACPAPCDNRPFLLDRQTMLWIWLKSGCVCVAVAVVVLVVLSMWHA